MGVTGSGKTTLGRRLAAELGWPYFEADDFHSDANRDKMSRGVPLTDEDRAPWLAALRARIDECAAAGRDAVFTCSALKEKYRQALLGGAGGDRVPHLVFLAAEPATVAARLRERVGHYMPASLIQSQFDILEIPAHALQLDARLSPELLLAEIRRACGV